MNPIIISQPIVSLPVTSGLKFYGDAISTPTGAVASWVDKSNSGNNATQVTSGQNPVCTANSINGHNALIFSAANSSTLALPSGLYGIPNAANTIFFIGSRTVDSSLQIVFNMGGASSTEQAFFFDDPGTVEYSNDGLNLNFAIASGVTTTTANIYTMTYNGASTVSLSVNGATAITNSGSVCSDITNAYIGGRNNANFFLSGAMGAFLIYNRLLSSIEISSVNTYLKNRYGTP